MSRDLLFKEAVAAAAGVEETTEVVMTTAAIPAEAKSIKTKTLEGPPGGDVVLLVLGRFTFLRHGSWATEKDPTRNQAISRWVLELLEIRIGGDYSLRIWEDEDHIHIHIDTRLLPMSSPLLRLGYHMTSSSPRLPASRSSP
ncbi:hypothetical protein Efla_007438 [Eimeria flavescens]